VSEFCNFHARLLVVKPWIASQCNMTRVQASFVSWVPVEPLRLQCFSLVQLRATSIRNQIQVIGLFQNRIDGRSISETVRSSFLCIWGKIVCDFIFNDSLNYCVYNQFGFREKNSTICDYLLIYRRLLTTYTIIFFWINLHITVFRGGQWLFSSYLSSRL
jgi:hypothetical protein